MTFKARVLAKKGQAGRPDRPIALLADNHLGNTLVGTVGVVNLVTVDEADQVGILLDGA